MVYLNYLTILSLIVGIEVLYYLLNLLATVCNVYLTLIGVIIYKENLVALAVLAYRLNRANYIYIDSVK